MGYNRDMPAFDLSPEPRLVLEDPSFLVVEKPVRLHSLSQGAGANPSLAAWIFERYPEAGPALAAGFSPESESALAARAAREGGLVHRLDYETSGLVLFARSAEALRALLRAQEEGKLLKTYRAWARPSQTLLPGSRPARGSPRGADSGAWATAIAIALGEGPLSYRGQEGAALELLARYLSGEAIVSRFRSYGEDAARVACLGEGEPPPRGRRGRSAVPGRDYRTEIRAASRRDDYLEVEAELCRGFRHQIRAHFAWIGLPLLGDPLYGDCAGREPRPARLYLHAERLEFPHPETGELVSVQA